jgi:hypothetical protein
MRLAWALALLPLATVAAQAQERMIGHMEGCLVWNREGNVSVRNECSRPLTLVFMDAGATQPQTADLAPGARFTADSVWGQSPGFMFTACPLGFRPSVRFAPENRETISVSLYNCVEGRPTS